MNQALQASGLCLLKLNTLPVRRLNLVVTLASREDFNFLVGDYRAAALKGIDAQPDMAQNLAAMYRRLVADGRWFEVIDGVVAGG